MKNGRIFALTAAIAALFAAPVAAQQQGKAIATSGYIKEVVTVAEEGAEPRTELIEPNSIIPGDRLLLVTGFENVSDEVVENFFITKPVSAALRLIPGEYGDAEVSVDGGENFGQLAVFTVQNEDGSTRSATESDITHLRWRLPRIEPGESGEIRFHAIIR